MVHLTLLSIHWEEQSSFKLHLIHVFIPTDRKHDDFVTITRLFQQDYLLKQMSVASCPAQRDPDLPTLPTTRFHPKQLSAPALDSCQDQRREGEREMHPQHRPAVIPAIPLVMPFPEGDAISASLYT